MACEPINRTRTRTEQIVKSEQVLFLPSSVDYTQCVNGLSHCGLERAKIKATNSTNSSKIPFWIEGAG